MNRQTKQDLRNGLANAALELRLAQEQIRRLSGRLADLTNSVPYKSGLHDGVTVGIQQLFLWLTDSREHANRVVEDMQSSPLVGPEFQQGYTLATAWLDEAISQLFEELEGRAHAVATSHTETPRAEGS